MGVVVKEAADGRQIVHYDGRAFELTPSPGEVICPAGGGESLHHRSDCGHIQGTETDWKTYPDPENNLWRRLLESAPTGDVEGRRAFAGEHGLLNGAGRPIKHLCETCTFSLTKVGEVKAPRSGLTDALEEFDRGEVTKRIPQITAEIEAVVRDFGLEGWPSLPLERYALGTPEFKASFCYRMEFGTSELCSMKGGSAKKHLVYRRPSDGSWYFDGAYTDEKEAWANHRSGFVNAFEAAAAGRLSEIDAIDEIRSAPALTSKAISCYFPSLILPITSQDHIRKFIFHLSGESAAGLGTFAAHERLRQLIEADRRFDGWHPYEVGSFLYWWADPRPSTTILKIAPAENARLWEECKAGGFICVGWDEVEDLTTFTSEDEFKEAFSRAYTGLYKGVKSKISAKANEVWRFFQLRPGDLVVANKGTREVLAVGKVTEAAYSWRPERAEYRHTVAVDWDESYAQTLNDDPQKSWATVTVAKVPGTLWNKLKAGGGKPPGPGPVVEIPAEPVFEQVAAHLDRKGQAVLYGPPGTGKTYTALRFAVWWLAARLSESGIDPNTEYGGRPFQEALNRLTRPERGDAPGFLTQVTFHPSYGYEDFIEGFRPVFSPGGEGLRLELTDGIFKKVCREAAAHPNKPYLVLIDEINRGDVPKILGELITLLEKDKRGVELVLPQSGEKFSVPSNVYVLGTMNTADRSIRLLDSALRRRFAFIELLPDPSLLDGHKIGNLDLGPLLRELNGRVVRHLGRERQIGHSFFLADGVPLNTEAELASVIRYEVIPLLQEYAYDDYALLSQFLGPAIVDAEAHSVTDLEDEKLVEELYNELQLRADEP